MSHPAFLKVLEKRTIAPRNRTKGLSSSRRISRISSTVAAVEEGQLNYRCGKCGNATYEVNTLSTAGGWLSRLFNFQYRKFSAITCTQCGYTELYKARSGALSNIADILAGG